jgi:predicted secreted protein
MRRLMLAALVAFLLPRVAAALPPPSAVKAGLLVKQLGSNNYSEREAASKALRALGKPGLPALRMACADKDAEVRKRARRLVEDMTPVPVAIERQRATFNVGVRFVQIRLDVKPLVLPALQEKKP